ncbi:tRNA (adenosine(37)-N6)-threonylcarbamoyltransferase complex dimerization subunit type 1 TsaB [Ureibacillus thermosphaericus]|uniref:tRNA (adenosine(37)-N6)-threonylcarbamoyltransferase complex dimerization subunit type 1 TsaB n=1 Tax=Ureibacillus thermosphaericus TaxID=51173 RepID=UPI000312F85D|nr:tRNA (adenosine(37)-N6)-threonylcarbamoyltransferase complex dimerization subunit type 1 TsaB [Ureibacillus thermosphaericus]
MIWLGIETSNAPLSVAIVRDGEVLSEIVQNTKSTHSVTCMPTIEEVFRKTNLKPVDIDAVAVSEGPGSYTGLRIGVTIAKTLSWTLKKPLVGISSLKVLASNVELFDGIICTMFDARRKNVYAAVYKGKELKTIIPEHHGSLEELLQQLQEYQETIMFVGSDVKKFKEEIQSVLGEQAKFAPPSLNLPRASKLIELAEKEPLPILEMVHSFVPKYHRLAEAEANWLKAHQKEQKG